MDTFNTNIEEGMLTDAILTAGEGENYRYPNTEHGGVMDALELALKKAKTEEIISFDHNLEATFRIKFEYSWLDAGEIITDEVAIVCHIDAYGKIIDGLFSGLPEGSVEVVKNLIILTVAEERDELIGLMKTVKWTN